MTKDILRSAPPIITKTSDIILPSNINERILNICDGYHKLAEIFIYLGYISIDDQRNKLAYEKLLNYIFAKNPRETIIMTLLGYCAEAVIVRRCNENPEINKKWLDIAYKWKSYDKKIPYETIAIGTGHHYTQTYYPNCYNPKDTQRDIIWINKENNEPLVNGFPFGSYIGLQIKTSINSKNNIKKDLTTKRYCVPIVYFDISNDYQKTLNDIINSYNGAIHLDFVSSKDIDIDAYKEVLDYYNIIKELCNNKMTIEQFIDIAINYKNLGNAIVKIITSKIETISNPIII